MYKKPSKYQKYNNTATTATTKGNYRSKYYNEKEKRIFLNNLIEIVQDLQKLENYKSKIADATAQIKNISRKNKLTYYENNGTYMTDKVPKITGPNKLNRPKDYKESKLKNKNKQIPYDLKPDRKKTKLKFTVYNQYNRGVKEYNPKGLQIDDKEFKDFLNSINASFTGDLVNLFESLNKEFKKSGNQVIIQTGYNKTMSNNAMEALFANMENDESIQEYVKTIGKCNLDSIIRTLFFGGNIPRSVDGVQFFAGGTIFNIIAAANMLSTMTWNSLLNLLINLYIYFASVFLYARDTEFNRNIMQGSLANFRNLYQLIKERIDEGINTTALIKVNTTSPNDMNAGNTASNRFTQNLAINHFRNEGAANHSKMNGSPSKPMTSNDSPKEDTYSPNGYSYNSPTQTSLIPIGSMNTNSNGTAPISPFPINMDGFNTSQETAFQGTNVAFGNNEELLSNLANSFPSSVPTTPGATPLIVNPKKRRMAVNDRIAKFQAIANIPITDTLNNITGPRPETNNEVTKDQINNSNPSMINIANNSNQILHTTFGAGNNGGELVVTHLPKKNQKTSIIPINIQLNKKYDKTTVREKIFLMNKLLYSMEVALSEGADKIAIDKKLYETFKALAYDVNLQDKARKAYKNPYEVIFGLTILDLLRAAETETGISDSNIIERTLQVESGDDLENLVNILNESEMWNRNKVGRSIIENLNSILNYSKNKMSGEGFTLGVSIKVDEEGDEEFMEDSDFEKRYRDKKQIMSDISKFIGNIVPLEGTEIQKALTEVQNKLFPKLIK